MKSLRPSLLFFAGIVALLGSPVARARPSVEALPLLFVQASAAGEPCRWQARGFDYSLCLTADSIRLQHAGRRVEWTYAGRSGSLEAMPDGEPFTRVSHFRGSDPSGWRPSQPAYGALRVTQLYPGIDLVLSGPGGRLKADYIVAPYADPTLIRLRFPTARAVRVGEHGGLVIETPDGVWHEAAPVLYQPGSPIRPIGGSVVVGPDDLAQFQPGPYDPAATLVIDPLLTFSSVLAGSSAPTALAVGPAGEIVLAGYTDDPAYPPVLPQRTFAGGVDALVVKLAPNGSSILQATFLGGSADDRAFGVSVDPHGGIYVAGWTTSANFPLANAWRSTLMGYRDAFLARIAPDGASLTFSTFLGGSGEEKATAVAAFASGVWVAGETGSSDFPLVAAIQSSRAGPENGFVARFTATGTPQFSSYLGGDGFDTVRAVAIDPEGGLYIAGGTTSTNLPIPALGFQPQLGGGMDGFILRLNPAATLITAGTYLGGSSGEAGNTELIQSITVSPQGDLIAGGTTPSSNFPVRSPWIGTHRGVSMGFVTRFNPGLSEVVWSTFVGGMNTDRVEGVATDNAGRVYAAGRTFSPDLPVLSPLIGNYQGQGDSFLIVVSPDGGAQVFGTYLGGSDSDAAVGVAVNPAGEAVVAGISSSPDYPRASALFSPAQPAPRFSISLISMTFHAPAVESVTPAAAQGDQRVFEVRVSDLDGAADVKTVLVLFNSTFASSGACYIAVEPGPDLFSLASDSGLGWEAATAGSAATLLNSQCRLRASGSSIVRSGTQVRIFLDLTFEPAFAGVRNIYLMAADQQQMTSNWSQPGVFTVSVGTTGAPPVVVSILPKAAAGMRQTFSLTVTDPQGGADVASARILIAPTLTLSNACHVRFTTNDGQVHLASDAGSAWTSAATGAATTLQNSQCRIHGASSGYALGSSAAVLWADIEFLPAWTGMRRAWGAATDQAQLEAVWMELAQFQATATPNAAPVLESAVAPGANGGLFEFRATDANGASDIQALQVSVGDSPDASSSCLVVFDAARNLISLHPGTSAEGWASVHPGQSGTAENPRCRIHGLGSERTANGTEAGFVIQIELKSAFSGPRLVRAHVIDGSGVMSAAYRLIARMPAQ